MIIFFNWEPLYIQIANMYLITLYTRQGTHVKFKNGSFYSPFHTSLLVNIFEISIILLYPQTDKHEILHLFRNLSFTQHNLQS